MPADGRPSFGVVFPARGPVDSLADFARSVDALGFDELWLAEDCFAHGGISAAAIALGSMRRARVGLGLLPAAVRNPAVAAMELATLGTVFPDRLKVAFGHGVEAWMRQIAARPANRLELLREVVGAVRRLLAGEEVTMRGNHVSLEAVALERPPQPPPSLFVGTTGPRTIAVARDLGVGLLLPEGAAPGAVAWARELLEPEAPVTVYAFLRIEDDREAALAGVAPFLEGWREMNLYSTLARFAGISLAEPIPREALSRLAIAGTPQQCAAGVAALRDAGADSVVFVPATDSPLATAERFADEVAPILARR